MGVTTRIKNAWSAFRDTGFGMDTGPGSSRAQYRTSSPFSATSYVSTIFNRIAIDVSMTKFKHVKVNPENEDEEDMKSGLSNCLNVEANIDQTHIQLIHDLVYSMFDEGVVALVPVETNTPPNVSPSYEILKMRVGRITMWFPQHVQIEVYDERTGRNERITMAKKDVAIIENPLYAVVNSENSTLKRLIRKLNQLDNIDDLADSGRLDLFISVPYGIKTEAQRAMAEKRIKDIEMQLAAGRNGIAYIDGTEKVTQLNRPANSQLLETVTNLSQQLYNQLGLTKSIFDGTAKEAELRTYYSRTIDPIVEGIVAELNRKFITKTARTQGQVIGYHRDMFKTVPIEIVAQLGDTFRRNEIASTNELRKIIGLKPSNDPRADELFNPNISDKNQGNRGLGTPAKVDDEPAVPEVVE